MANTIRDLLISDLVELESQAQFPLENLTNKPMILQKTFEDEEGLIGSIMVNRTVEVAAIFNDRSRRDLIEVMKQIPDLLYRELIPLGYRDIHAFIKNEKFANILVKHFGFEDAKGRALVRRY